MRYDPDMNVQAEYIRPLSQVLDEMPEGEKWEIIGGGLYCQAASSFDHNLVRDGFVETLRPPYQRGYGGPGGWWILSEQRFVGPDPEKFTLEPDVAGWRKERMPNRPKVYPSIAPDWVCEVLSESTQERDYGIKKRSYAELKVPWYWIVSLKRREIEVYQLRNEAYHLVRTLKVRAEALPPFDDVAIEPATVFDL